MSNNNDELWLECKTPGAIHVYIILIKQLGKYHGQNHLRIYKVLHLNRQQIIQMKKRRKPHHRNQNYVGVHYVAL